MHVIRNEINQRMHMAIEYMNQINNVHICKSEGGSIGWYIHAGVYLMVDNIAGKVPFNNDHDSSPTINKWSYRLYRLLDHIDLEINLDLE